MSMQQVGRKWMIEVLIKHVTEKIIVCRVFASKLKL